MRKKGEKKFRPSFEPGTSGTPGKVLTTAHVHMVLSSHQSNMFLLISLKQRHQSQFYKYKVINFLTLHAHINISY